MRLVFALLAALAVTALGSCSRDTSCEPVCDPCACDPIIMFDGINQITIDPDPVCILQATVTGGVLNLEVEYGGGCRDHDFKLYGASGFMESLPVQAALFLSHDAHDDPCDALVHRELAFDLLPLRAAYLRGYSDNGPIKLRILEPGATEPFVPLPLYRFCR